MTWLDYATVASYIALNIDVVLQIHHIRNTRSSRDLSLTGLVVRYGAILLILYKFISLDDNSLILGQTLVALTFTAYLVLAITYARHKPKRKRK